jgi:hypothetical protein
MPITSFFRQNHRQNGEKNRVQNPTFCARCLFILRELKKSLKKLARATGKNRGNLQETNARFVTPVTHAKQIHMPFNFSPHNSLRILNASNS